jgi:hypothetical protein
MREECVTSIQWTAELRRFLLYTCSILSGNRSRKICEPRICVKNVWHVSNEQLNIEDFSSTPPRYSMETDRGKYVSHFWISMKNVWHVYNEQLNIEDFSSTPVRYSLETDRRKYLSQGYAWRIYDTYPKKTSPLHLFDTLWKQNRGKYLSQGYVWRIYDTDPMNIWTMKTSPLHLFDTLWKQLEENSWAKDMREECMTYIPWTAVHVSLYLLAQYFATYRYTENNANPCRGKNMAAYEYITHTALYYCPCHGPMPPKPFKKIKNKEVTYVEDTNYVLLNENVKFKYHNT